VGSVFGPIRFLLPVCRFCWFLYTSNIHLYMHIFRPIFLSNYWWQELYKNQLSRQTGSRNRTDPKTLPTISYTYMTLVTKYQISAVNCYCLPTLLIFMHTEHTFCICPFLVAFFSPTIDGRDLIFGHKLHIGTIWWIQKRLPRYEVLIWSLWPNIRSLPSIVAEKNVTKNVHIQCMFNVYKNQQSRQTGSRNLTGPKALYPISWEAFFDSSGSYFLFADYVDFYTHWTYICICTFFVPFF
jgi:hypothetical protein